MSRDVYSSKTVKCRKPHRCAYCSRSIEAWEHALMEHGIYEKVPFTRYACTHCIPLLDGFWEWCEYESNDIADDFVDYLEFMESQDDENTSVRL